MKKFTLKYWPVILSFSFIAGLVINILLNVGDLKPIHIMGEKYRWEDVWFAAYLLPMIYALGYSAGKFIESKKNQKND